MKFPGIETKTIPSNTPITKHPPINPTTYNTAIIITETYYRNPTPKPQSGVRTLRPSYGTGLKLSKCRSRLLPDVTYGFVCCAYASFRLRRIDFLILMPSYFHRRSNNRIYCLPAATIRRLLKTRRIIDIKSSGALRFICWQPNGPRVARIY